MAWIEARARRMRAEVYAVAALEAYLHKPLRHAVSLHSDSGHESTSGHPVRFCHARDITFTQSRPYQRNDNAQTPCTRMPAHKDVSAETKGRLLATRAKLDITSLLHEIFLCQEQLDEITNRRQPLAINKRGNYAYISSEFMT